MERPVDADTLRWRALHDAKGIVLREGVTYRASGVTTWQLRRSLDGRVNQVDLIINGIVWRTGARRDAEKAIKRGKWPKIRAKSSTPRLTIHAQAA